MALTKLWNAVFGKRPSAELAPLAEPVAVSAPAIAAPVKPSSERTPAPVNPNAPVSAKTLVSAKSPEKSAPIKLSKAKTKSGKKSAVEEIPVVAPEPATVLRMFRRKNNAWTKLIGSRTVNIVLDLNVQDGSRAVELLEAIVDSNSPAPKYVAIGMFELAGEKLTVRQFHQKVRSAGGQPVVIPMPLVEGLRRLSQTVGTADLILLDLTEQQIADPVVARLLQRIASKDALVLRRDAKDRWQAMATQSRAA